VSHVFYSILGAYAYNFEIEKVCGMVTEMLSLFVKLYQILRAVNCSM
jgi:hypothetical protein